MTIESSLVAKMQEDLETLCQQIASDKIGLDNRHERYNIGDLSMKASTETAFGRRLVRDGMQMAYDWGADEVAQACARIVVRGDQPAFLHPYLNELQKSASELREFVDGIQPKG